MKGNVEQFKQFLVTLDEKERENYNALLAAVVAEVKLRGEKCGDPVCFGIESAMDLIVCVWRWQMEENHGYRNR